MVAFPVNRVKREWEILIKQWGPALKTPNIISTCAETFGRPPVMRSSTLRTDRANRAYRVYWPDSASQKGHIISLCLGETSSSWGLTMRGKGERLGNIGVDWVIGVDGVI